MTMNSPVVFRCEEFGEIRTLNIGGEPWFVGKDIAVSLGYSNPQKEVRDHVFEEDRTVNDSALLTNTRQKLLTMV